MRGTSILILTLLVVMCMSYLQIALIKHQLKKQLHHKGDPVCITTQEDKKIDEKKHKKQKTKHKKSADEEESEQDQEESFDDDEVEESQNYKEICYEKDISYSIPVMLNNQFHFIAVDTTAPISWIKGSKCFLEGSSKKCSLVKENFKESIEKILKHNKSTKKHSKQQYAIIQGSSQLVKGFQQKVQNFSMTIKDSSRMTNLIQLLMLGFYMKQEHDQVVLEQTNIINATEISKNLNYLCDGAISFRFDENSQSSFLKELFEYQRSSEKVVTIYIQQKNISYISIGQIATKYSKYGYGGIDWIDLEDEGGYGKMPKITSVIIDNNGKTYSQLRDKEYSAILSLSASYIGIPKDVMAEWDKKFNKKAKCVIDEDSLYLTCQHLKQEDENKIITFQFGDKKISFTLQELILEKGHSKTILNMKQSIHDTYAILGEPFFQKYLVMLDYDKNKFGVAQKRQPIDTGIINVVSLVRFICFVFLFGCSFIICFTPIQRCIHVLKSRGKYGASEQKTGQARRLKQYSPVQQNPYDELSGQIKEALEEDQH